MFKIFRDRVEAGRLLAEKLQNYHAQPDTIIMALPRGGVPVGFEIAQALKIPLDIFLVRKLGAPGQEELAFGAIALGDIEVFNQSIVQQLELDQYTINEVIAEEKQILAERNRKYRGDLPLPDLKNRTIILVDDGIATGATMRAAVKALRKIGCKQLTIAVPVAPQETLSLFHGLVDKIICLETPSPFFAIGSYYQDFSQTSDEEVYRLLALSHESK
jgi:putative phosphoribosyl transferase